MLLKSPAYSRTMDAKGPKMVQGEFTPEARLSQHIKDVRLILAEAKRGDAQLPFSTIHLELLNRPKPLVWRTDNTAIIQIIEDRNLRPLRCNDKPANSQTRLPTLCVCDRLSRLPCIEC